MKLTPRQLRLIIKEELSTVLIEDGTVPQSRLPRALEHTGWSPGNTTDYWSRLYDVELGAWASSEGDRIAGKETKAPVVKFTVTDISDDFGTGEKWKLVVSGGERKTAKGGQDHTLVSMVRRRMDSAGGDSRAPTSLLGLLSRENISAENLATAVDEMQALLGQYHKPVDLADTRPSMDMGA